MVSGDPPARLPDLRSSCFICLTSRSYSVCRPQSFTLLTELSSLLTGPSRPVSPDPPNLKLFRQPEPIAFKIYSAGPFTSPAVRFQSASLNLLNHLPDSLPVVRPAPDSFSHRIRRPVCSASQPSSISPDPSYSTLFYQRQPMPARIHHI